MYLLCTFSPRKNHITLLWRFNDNNTYISRRDRESHFFTLVCKIWNVIRRFATHLWSSFTISLPDAFHIALCGGENKMIWKTSLLRGFTLKWIYIWPLLMYFKCFGVNCWYKKPFSLWNQITSGYLLWYCVHPAQYKRGGFKITM